MERLYAAIFFLIGLSVLGGGPNSGPNSTNIGYTRPADIQADNRAPILHLTRSSLKLGDCTDFTVEGGFGPYLIQIFEMDPWPELLLLPSPIGQFYVQENEKAPHFCVLNPMPRNGSFKASVFDSATRLSSDEHLIELVQ